jgi:hypothetical protein
MLARATLVIAATAAIVWCAIWLHQNHELDKAHSAAFAPGATKDPVRVRKVVSMFDAARAHTPDSLPLMYEALFVFEAGDRRKAAALAADVVRREPKNVSAWSLLGQADSARADEARERIAQLNPLALRGG